MKTKTERIHEIEEEMKVIKSDCAYWRSCQDGSYEMALSGRGYYKLAEELQKLINLEDL